MTVQDLWALSPVIAMAGVAIAAVVIDLIWRNRKVTAYAAFFGLLAPLFFSLNLWFGWTGDLRIVGRSGIGCQLTLDEEPAEWFGSTGVPSVRWHSGRTLSNPPRLHQS